MALPCGYTTPQEYFKESLDFLRSYAWIYRETNTRFIKVNILHEMPQEFHEYFNELHNDQLNTFPFVHEHQLDVSKKPEVEKFRQKLANLIPAIAFKEPREMEICPSLMNLKKMNLKKQHEIQRLAAMVQQRLRSHHTHSHPLEKICLIDFGCGLGYLSECLYRINENFLILGLESDSYRVQAAQKRLQLYMPQAKRQAIHYRQEFITTSSRHFITKSVQELFQFNYNETTTKVTTPPTYTLAVAFDTPTSSSTSGTLQQQQPSISMAIIGLHACADLSITSMKLFLQMPQVRHLIIMPCCYHKMAMCANTLKFHNFPLSQCLRDEVAAGTDTSDYVAYLNRPFLRLACQQTLKRWHKCSAEQHMQHGREMFLRAVAEALKEETESVVKNKKLQSNDSLTSNGVIEFDAFSRLYQLKSQVDNTDLRWSEKQKLKYYEIMEKYPNGERLAEGLTCLQTSIQKLCENLVLYDRLCYLEEAASDLNIKISARYEKLMDEELSPRCYVLIAEKL